MNEDIKLPRLAFGTSGIMGAAATEHGRLKLLETVLDNGISHFDTAPLYGQGDAEFLLGKFLTSRRDKVTIATKYGLQPRRYNPLLHYVKPLVRVVNRRVLDYRRSLSNVNQTREFKLKPFLQQDSCSSDFGEKNAPVLNSAALTKQLEISLAKLNTDYVDCLLLHDVSLTQLDDAFVEQLLSLQAQGKVVRLGLATTRSKTVAIKQRYPELTLITQVASTSFTIDKDSLNSEGSHLICHSCFQTEFSWLMRWVELNHKTIQDARVIDDSFEFDLNSIVTRLLLQRASQKIEGGTVLFSSSNAKNIIRNARLIESEDKLLRFVLNEMRQQANLK